MGNIRAIERYEVNVRASPLRSYQQVWECVNPFQVHPVTVPAWPTTNRDKTNLSPPVIHTQFSHSKTFMFGSLTTLDPCPRTPVTPREAPRCYPTLINTPLLLSPTPWPTKISALPPLLTPEKHLQTPKYRATCPCWASGVLYLSVSSFGLLVYMDG